MTEPEWTDEERGFVETALAAADAGDAGHWPTVATYLAAEVRRLRASEGATPTGQVGGYAPAGEGVRSNSANSMEGATPAIDRAAVDRDVLVLDLNEIEDAIRDEFMRFGGAEIADDARRAANAVLAVIVGAS